MAPDIKFGRSGGTYLRKSSIARSTLVVNIHIFQRSQYLIVIIPTMLDNLKSCAGRDGFVCGPSFEFGPDPDIAGFGVCLIYFTHNGYSLLKDILQVFAAFIAAAVTSFVIAIISLVMEGFQYFG